MKTNQLLYAKGMRSEKINLLDCIDLNLLTTRAASSSHQSLQQINKRIL